VAYVAGAIQQKFPPVGLGAINALLVVACPEGAADAPPFDVPGMAAESWPVACRRTGWLDADVAAVLPRVAVTKILQMALVKFLAARDPTDGPDGQWRQEILPGSCVDAVEDQGMQVGVWHGASHLWN
jgi:hypothetical protein